MFGRFRKKQEDKNDPTEIEAENPYSSIAPREQQSRDSSVIRKRETHLHDYAQHQSRSRSVAQTLEREQRSISLTSKEREGHMHIIGSTGKGKSKFMELLLRHDILNRKAGLCLLDPHGSLYEEVLLYASHRHPQLAERFVLFNPAEDMGFVTGFNPIPQDTEHMDYIIQSLVSACLKAWGQDNTATTPRISRWLENIFYTIIANDLTLIEAAPLMGIYNKEHREVLLRKVQNEVILDDWQMFETSSPIQKQNLIEGAANRLRRFIGNRTIRDIIGCRKKTLDFTQVMKEGKIVLINLNGGNKITHENSSLLGIMMVNEIFRCAKFRNPKDPSTKPFYVYIDEFAQFVTQDIARTLEEARKFKVFMVLAHQHLAQLKIEDEYLYASVMTNCKNKVVFGGLSREDSELMTDELMTGFVNLKAVKDEIVVTKQRTRLELRKTRSTSKARGGGSNWSEGTNRSTTTSEGQTRSTSEGTTSSQGGSDSRRANGERGNSSQNQSSGSSRSQSSGESQGRAEMQGSSQSKGGSESWSETETENENWVNNPEEYGEVSSRTFWTKDELHYIEMAEIKNQGMAHAFIKCGSKPPYKVKVDFVSPVVFNARTSPQRVTKFIETSQRANNVFCVSREDALLETQQRQLSCFGEAISFDDFTSRHTAPPTSEEKPVGVVEPDDEPESPFA